MRGAEESAFDIRDTVFKKSSKFSVAGRPEGAASAEEEAAENEMAAGTKEVCTPATGRLGGAASSRGEERATAASASTTLEGGSSAVSATEAGVPPNGTTRNEILTIERKDLAINLKRLRVHDASCVANRCAVDLNECRQVLTTRTSHPKGLPALRGGHTPTDRQNDVAL